MPVRVLVIDDHETMRKSMVTYLRAFDDIEVVADTSDPVEGLSMCESLAPDVALVDVRMKPISGLEVARRLRAAGRDIRIIGFSAFAREEIEDKVKEAGIDAYIDKTGNPFELVDAIRGNSSPSGGAIDREADRSTR